MIAQHERKEQHAVFHTVPAIREELQRTNRRPHRLPLAKTFSVTPFVIHV